MFTLNVIYPAMRLFCVYTFFKTLFEFYIMYIWPAIFTKMIIICFSRINSPSEGLFIKLGVVVCCCFYSYWSIIAKRDPYYCIASWASNKFQSLLVLTTDLFLIVGYFIGLSVGMLIEDYWFGCKLELYLFDIWSHKINH